MLHRTTPGGVGPRALWALAAPPAPRLLRFLPFLLLFAGCGGAGRAPVTAPPAAIEQVEQQPPAAASPATGADRGGGLVMASDIEQRLSRFAPTDIDFDEKLVDVRDRPVVVKLIEAAKILDDIFLDQVSPANRALRERLVSAGAPRAALEYFDIMYGPWDRLQGHAPFLGTEPKPLGAGYYPPDLTREELESWIKAHPDQEQAARGYFTVIRRRGQGLEAVPYSQAYGPRLKRAAALLREAARLSRHETLRRYLELRAEAFLSDDYYASDVAWMDLGDSPLEVVIGPYEVYEDRLMGYKAAMEAFITARDPISSAQLQKLAAYNQALEANLPLPRRMQTRRGTESPISVVYVLFTAGDTRAGVQTAAFNLPNDERVRTAKGSKKVMLKNVTEAKFQQALLPIARRVVAERLLERITFDAYFTDILLHEVAHGVGPGQITVEGRKTEVSRELKELYPAIEECKADIVGLVNGAFLVRKGALPRELGPQLPAAYLAGIFRAVRFGTESAHARGVLLAFNYLREKKAITYDAGSGRFDIDERIFDARVRDLARELLLVQARGSYAQARKLLETYGVVPPELEQALAKLGDIPVDIRPRYTVLEKMKSW